MTYSDADSAPDDDTIAVKKFSRGSLIGFVIVVLVSGLLGFFLGHSTMGTSHRDNKKTPATVTVTKTVKSRAKTQRHHAQSASEVIPQDVPHNVLLTLQKIDQHAWPPEPPRGTHGGESWHNREGKLPREDSNGNAIEYKEWDVNRKKAHHHRDAQRIITGSDHSAYYTLDHYRTFTRIR